MPSAVMVTGREAMGRKIACRLPNAPAENRK